MSQIEHFVPGERDGEPGVLRRLRWPIPAGVTRAYVEAYTNPGEGVLVPYCQGPATVREGLGLGRRVLALNFDPLLVLLVEAALMPRSTQELDAAVARLGDSLKQGIPLRHYLADLYATTCPACLRPAVADYFVWDRDQDLPLAKYLRCPACSWDGQTALDPEDRERLDKVPTRGMHYHYVMDRVSPRREGEGFRTRLESLLALYSPRNLYALAELTLKIESLFPEGRLNRTLKVLLADCLDRCSSLAPLPGRAARRGLARPDRYLERNVWRAFEEAVKRLQAGAMAPVAGLADDLATYQADPQARSGFVDQGLVRDLARSLPPRNLGLILSSPPALDSAAWSLSYLWGGWLLGSEAVQALRPLVRQRTPDPAWYARVMGGSLRTLASLLRDDGRLVLVLSDQRPAMLEALVMAACEARLGITSLVQQGADYRLELAPSLLQAAAVPGADLETEIQETAVEAAVDTIRVRGEPTAWRTLHAAIQQRLAREGLYTRALAAEEGAPSPVALVAEQVQLGLGAPGPLRLLEGDRARDLWWLVDPADVAEPLCDRVELAAFEILQAAPALGEADFGAALCGRFPGPLTPEADLMRACLRAYGRQAVPGRWQLRDEDQADARQAERRKIVDNLLALGERLGYQTGSRAPFDLAWRAGGPGQLQAGPQSHLAGGRGRSGLAFRQVPARPPPGRPAGHRRIHLADHRRPRPDRRAGEGPDPAVLSQTGTPSRQIAPAGPVPGRKRYLLTGGRIMELKGKRVAVLAENMYQELELWYPLLRLREAGAETFVVGTGSDGTYKSKNGYPVQVDVTADQVSAADVDAVVIPGGYAPDLMRRYPAMVNLVREAFEQGKVVAAICHAGWMLASAGVVQGKEATCFFAIKDDLVNAGATYVDAEVVRDGNLITSRVPSDLPAFCRTIIEALGE